MSVTVLGAATLLASVSLVTGSTRLARAHATAGLEWRQVVASYAAVTDYTCTYEKEERAISNGELQRIRLSFRKPLDVRLEWLDAAGEVDQIAVYRQGRNDGRLLARRRGLFGSLVGTVHLDPQGMKALQDSRHPITDVGVGYVIERITDESRHERLTIDPPVEEVLDGEPHDRFGFAAVTQASLVGVDGARRGVIWISRVLQLPVKVEIVDATGLVLERHRFKDLRVNVGLSDATFTL